MGENDRTEWADSENARNVEIRKIDVADLDRAFAGRKGRHTMPSSKPVKASTGRTDWAALRAMPEDEIERIASEDEDNPATDESYRAEATIRGPAAQTSIHATFDQEVVEFFKREGPGYASRMNAVRRDDMEAQRTKKAGR